MTSPRPTDLNFALPPGFVPAVRPVPAPATPAPVRKVQAPTPAVRRIEPAPRRVVPSAPTLRAVQSPAPAVLTAAVPVIEAVEPSVGAPVAEPKPRAPRKPRATTAKTAAPTTTAPGTTAAKTGATATTKTTARKTTTAKTPPAKPAPRGRTTTTTAVDEIIEHEAGRILEDAARTAADMLAAARSTAARLGAELAAEQEQRRREMEDAVADLADYLDALAHRLRSGAPLSVG